MSETDRAGRTKLHYAALEGNVEQVRSLLAAGADAGLSDRNGMTPLHFAAQGRHSDVAAMLLNAGAAVDAEDKYGNTPLWTAVFNSRGVGSAISALRARGADPEHRNHNKASPVELARTIANYDIAQFFAEVAD